MSDDPKSNAHPTLNIPQSLSSNLISGLPSSAFYIPSFISPSEEAALLQQITSAPLPTWKTLSHRRLQAYPSVLSSSNTLLQAPLPSWLAEPIVSRLLATPLLEPVLETTTPTFKGEAHATRVPHAGAVQNNIFSNSPHGAPNHCLVNEYLPSQGIYPHEDGSAYWPVVCTVSLGSHTVLEISRKRRDRDVVDDSDSVPATQREDEGSARKWRLLQERRSLLISTGEVYTDCLHGIEGVVVDEELRPGGIVNWDLLGDRMEFEEGRREREKRISLTFRDVLKVKALGKAFGALRR